MVDMRTRYLGLELESPLVPSASPLSRSLDTARRLEDAGAGAIVMYSLFEEELRHEEEAATRFLIEQEIGFGEAQSFLPFNENYQRGLDQYLEQLQRLKRHLHIPVIASLNGVSLDGWICHGRALEDAGADALELNVYYVAADAHESGELVECRYLELLRELRAAVSLPIAMKLSPYFSAIPHLISMLEQEGAQGVALFNRFYQPDIDLETLRIVPRLHLSTSRESLLAMRWIAMLYGRVQLSLAATGGVHEAADALKLLLAGADVVHMCSALLQRGPGYLAEVRAGMERWLSESAFSSVRQMQGSLSHMRSNDPTALERANYVAVLDNYSAAPGVQR